MDPKATVTMLLQGCKDPTPATLRRALNEWIGHGGFKPRIALHPACDLWMRGAKYATVVGAYRGGFSVNVEIAGETVGRRIYRLRMVDVLEAV